MPNQTLRTLLLPAIILFLVTIIPLPVFASDGNTGSRYKSSSPRSNSSQESGNGQMNKTSDMDGDGVSDAEEIKAGTNPNDAKDFPDDKGETSSQKTEKELNDKKDSKSKDSDSNRGLQWVLIGIAATAFLAFLLRDQPEA